MANYYQILGISQTAGIEDVKRAYRKQAKLFHPDVNPGKSEEHFKQIVTAYKILSDSSKRYSYDLKLSNNHRKSQTKKTKKPSVETQTFYRQYEFYSKKEKIGDLPPVLIKPFYTCVLFLGFIMIFVPILAVFHSLEYWTILILIPFGIALIWIIRKHFIDLGI